MKKIIYTFIALMFLQVSSLSATIKVEALNDFSTENPSESLAVKAVTPLELDDIIIKPDYILTGDIVDVKPPKRLKRDARFSFVLTHYTDENGNFHSVKKGIKGKYTNRFDYKSAAKSAALGVGNHFLTGLSAGYYALEGAVKNEEDNRLKSSAVSVYENSPLSYVEKGEHLNISKNQIFILKFKLKDEEDTDEDFE